MTDLSADRLEAIRKDVAIALADNPEFEPRGAKGFWSGIKPEVREAWTREWYRQKGEQK